MINRLIASVLLVIASFALAACGGEAIQPTKPAKQESVAELFAKSKNLSGLSYDYVMSNADMKGMVVKGKFWSMGKKSKVETTAGDQKVITIVDGDANTVYNYIPEQKMLAKMPMDASNAPGTPDRYSKETDPAKFKVLETVDYEGVKCRVLLLEEPQGVRQKIWVREDLGLPIRVEVSGDKVDRQVVEFKNIKVGPIPDSEFALPQGVPVTDLKEVMKNMRQKS